MTLLGPSEQSKQGALNAKLLCVCLYVCDSLWEIGLVAGCSIRNTSV